MFINMKSVPQEGDTDFEAFVAAEMDKIQYGLTINGVYISNWLYWHINYWKAYIPTLDTRSGDTIDTFLHPQLRDNEWLIAQYLQQAKDEKKGLLIIGGRRIAKTSIVASWLSLGGTIYQGSDNVIVGNNKQDINNITLQMDKGLAEVEPFLRYDRLFNDWGKQASLGWKEKRSGGNRKEWSRFTIKNTGEGKATEVLAGITPKTLVYDEIGKALMKEAFLASVKAFASPWGWRCVPILTGTGGDFTNGKDAEEMFHSPERYNLLAVDVKDEARKTAIFIPANYAVDYPKEEKSLSEYLNIKIPSELDIIKIQATNWELSNAMIDAELEKWRTSNDQKEFLKALMYSPRTVDECFLSNSDENPFPVDALKKHLDTLTRTQEKPFYARLSRDPATNKVTYTEEMRLRPVSDYPVTKDTIKDAPVVIYEAPMPNPPSYLYISGGDPYNQNKSMTSPSLGTIYIYKRVYDPVAGTFQRSIVASYTARPEEMKTWHQTAEMLLELYTATCMIENIGTNFIQYMENRNRGHYLADGFNLAKELNPRTMATFGKIKGLPAVTAVQNHYKNLIIQYLTEPLVIGQDKETLEPIEVMGLTRIKDPMLIVELINFRETEFRKGTGMKKKGNFDRYVSFGHVLVYDEYMDKIAPFIKVAAPVEVKSEEKKKITPHSPFILDRNPNRTSLVTRNPFL